MVSAGVYCSISLLLQSANERKRVDALGANQEEGEIAEESTDTPRSKLGRTEKSRTAEEAKYSIIQEISAGGDDRRRFRDGSYHRDHRGRARGDKNDSNHHDTRSSHIRDGRRRQDRRHYYTDHSTSRYRGLDELVGLEDFIVYYFSGQNTEDMIRNKVLYSVVTKGVKKLSVDLLYRVEAMNQLLFHAYYTFIGGNYNPCSTPAVAVVYATCGAGKSELFSRLVAAPDDYVQQYVSQVETASAVQQHVSERHPASEPSVSDMSTSSTEASGATSAALAPSPRTVLSSKECLYVAVSFSCNTDMTEAELDLLNDPQVPTLATAIALRLVYIYCAPVSSFEELITRVGVYAKKCGTGWHDTFELQSVIDKILLMTKKKRMYVLVDETMRIIGAFNSKGRYAPCCTDCLK
jgi:hypothetical protein